jgi:hypothetical protein
MSLYRRQTLAEQLELVRPKPAPLPVRSSAPPAPVPFRKPQKPPVPPPPLPRPPSPPPPPRPAAGKPVPSPRITSQEVFCRTCDARVVGPIPPGWWHLSRHVAPGSLAWTGRARTAQPMGLYCSLYCLLEAMPRLELLQNDLQQRGVGMRSLAPGETPPVLPVPVTKGGPR